MATTRVNFRLPEDLVKRADLAATVESKNRTEVVTEALVAYLEALETQERYRESLVERFLDDEVGFLALREAIGLRDAEAVRASKALLDRSEEVSGTIAGLDPE
jgi:predicted transcriptional regulator